jgi:hypothetical protein
VDVKSGGLKVTVLNSPDPHVFGSGSQPDATVQHQPTADFHTRRQKLVADYTQELRLMEQRHKRERDELSHCYEVLHAESREIFAGKRR